jgi:hypothetical protein
VTEKRDFSTEWFRVTRFVAGMGKLTWACLRYPNTGSAIIHYDDGRIEVRPRTPDSDALADDPAFLGRQLYQAIRQIKEFRRICDPGENQVLVTHVEMIGSTGMFDRLADDDDDAV